MKGLADLVFAAAIACTQTDLKRILAFSTLSQLGLMMFSLGNGDHGYAASMFHIFTHAFFKCLLFLSAGVVIHAVHGNDVRDAAAASPDGLRKALPRTYWATLIAVLAISGLWPLSGFFSKEEILHAAWANGHYGAFLAGLCTSGLTAFYMSRYFFLVFHGGKGNRTAGAHGEDGGGSHGTHGLKGPHGHGLHEGFLMTLPILILAVPSALIGWFSKGFFLRTVVSTALHPTALAASEGEGAHGAVWLPAVATALALLGIALSAYWYGVKKNAPAFPGRAAPLWYRVLSRKFYIDELYLFLARRVGSKWIAGPIAWSERNLVNGAFDRVTGAIKRLARAQSLVQSGQVQVYIALALLGLYLLAHFAGLGS